LGSDGDGLRRRTRVVPGILIFLDLECVESLRGRGETGGLHVGELVGEDCSDYALVVGIMREVHEDGVGTDVGVLCRVDPW
jgi:hypothetical protein